MCRVLGGISRFLGCETRTSIVAGVLSVSLGMFSDLLMEREKARAQQKTGLTFSGQDRDNHVILT